MTRHPPTTDDHQADGPDGQADTTNRHQPNTPDGHQPDTGRTGGSSRARGKVTDAERARMRQLAEQGKSVRAIAKELGRSADAVSRAVRDVSNDRRQQTAAATQARTVDFAEERTRLMEQTLRASRLAMSRFIGVDQGDHRGSLDESRAFNQLIGAYARLDDRHTRAQGPQGMSDVDQYLAWTRGTPDPALLPDDGSPE